MQFNKFISKVLMNLKDAWLFQIYLLITQMSCQYAKYGTFSDFVTLSVFVAAICFGNLDLCLRHLIVVFIKY